MPLDPQAQLLIDQLSSAGAPPLEQLTVDAARQVLDGFAALGGTGPEVDCVEDCGIPGPGGEIPARLYWPGGSGPFPMLAWFHGGGWVLGSIEHCDSLCRQLANDTGAMVANVGYRLAPEHPFPAAPDDCIAAVRWLADGGGRLGGDPARLAVGGESAGGNLAAVTAQRARDEGGPDLVFQLLVYPVTDGTLSHESIVTNGEGYVLTAGAMRWFWDLYMGPDADRRDPAASPLDAKDLSGLAPAMVVTAEFDPLRDEGEAYGHALSQAGVPATVRRYDGMIHGFFGLSAIFDSARQAVKEASAALSSAFGEAGISS